MFELMVGLMLLGMTVVTLFGMTSALTGTGRQSEARAVAMSVARSQMETLLATSQGNRKVVTDRPFEIEPSLREQFPSAAEDGLRGVFSVAAVQGAANLQTLTVTVKWKNMTSEEPGGGSEAISEAPWSSVTLVRLASSATDLSSSPFDGDRFEPDDDLFVQLDSESSGGAGTTPTDPATTVTAPVFGTGKGSHGGAALTGMYGSRQR